jgi:hypothetical protein
LPPLLLRRDNAGMSQFFKPWMRIVIAEALLVSVVVWLAARRWLPFDYRPPSDSLFVWAAIVGVALGLPFHRPIKGTVIGALVFVIPVMVVILLFLGRAILGH